MFTQHTLSNLYKLLKTGLIKIRHLQIPSRSTYSQWSKLFGSLRTASGVNCLGLCDSSVLLNGGDCDETMALVVEDLG